MLTGSKHTYIHTYLCTYTGTHIHIYIHRYIRTYIHTCVLCICSIKRLLPLVNYIVYQVYQCSTRMLCNTTRKRLLHLKLLSDIIFGSTLHIWFPICLSSGRPSQITFISILLATCIQICRALERGHCTTR